MHFTVFWGCYNSLVKTMFFCHLGSQLLGVGLCFRFMRFGLRAWTSGKDHRGKFVAQRAHVAISYILRAQSVPIYLLRAQASISKGSNGFA